MYIYEIPECFNCQSSENALMDVKYWMKYLLEMLYSKAELCEDEVERSLMEICAVINLKFPTNDLNIERKQFLEPKHISADVDKWLEWNQLYLKQLTTAH